MTEVATPATDQLIDRFLPAFDRAGRQMARYWWLIRPFVAYIMRATLRTISASVSAASTPNAGSGSAMV